MKNKDYYLQGVIPVALSSTLWGINLFLRKLVLDQVHPIMLNFLTVWGAAIFMIVIFKFKPSSVILQDVNANILYCIDLFQPYDGLTESNIGIGNLYTDVIAAYGEPQETITEQKVIVYDSGIAFHFNNGMTVVTGMSIFRERAALTFE